MSRPRLDEILIEKGLITDDQITEALEAQQEDGGKIGSHLLRLGYITEQDLVDALAVQLECDSVVLSDRLIPPAIVECVPSKIAVARKVVPFEYDTENNVLKIACFDPTDEDLRTELEFIQRGRDIKLFVASDSAIEAALKRYYMNRETVMDINKLVLKEQEEDAQIAALAEHMKQQREKKQESTESSETAESDGESDDASSFDSTPEGRGRVLIVSDMAHEDEPIQRILENDNYAVLFAESATEAIEQIAQTRFNTLFIRDSVSGDYLDLIDRLRKLSPSTAVRFYDSNSALLLSGQNQQTELDLTLKHLDMLTSLMSSRDGYPSNHSGWVGKYADRLCQRIGLPDKDRFVIISAAFLHDFAKYYYRADSSTDYREHINLTIRLLESLNYSPTVVSMLRSMYADLRGRFTRRLPIEKLGANIITIVDLYCHHTNPNEKMSLDRFDTVARKIEDLVGRLFMQEVADAFIDLVQDEILRSPDESGHQVMIFGDDCDIAEKLTARLNDSGYRTVTHCDVESFSRLYRRSQPDIIILVSPDDPWKTISTLEDLGGAGVDITTVPTLVLAPPTQIAKLTSLFSKGVEDIIAYNDEFDFLSTKLRRIADRIDDNRRAASTNDSSRGRLADMNLIDLLQAMGPARKTIHISVTPTGSQRPRLHIYLKRGRIVHAMYDNRPGPEAIYETISWRDGWWSVEPILSSQLPPANISMSNEMVLMEACRRHDESQKMPTSED
jgi:PleD family two-component response regulator